MYSFVLEAKFLRALPPLFHFVGLWPAASMGLKQPPASGPSPAQGPRMMPPGWAEASVLVASQGQASRIRLRPRIFAFFIFQNDVLYFFSRFRVQEENPRWEAQTQVLIGLDLKM